MNTHTPTPWTTDGRFIVQQVAERSFWPGQSFIADCYVSQAAADRGELNTQLNAELICRAVNLHDELVAALQALTSTARTFRDVPKANQEWGPLDDEALESAFTVLNKAKPDSCAG